MSQVLDYMRRKSLGVKSASKKVRSNAVKNDRNCPDPTGCEDTLRSEAAILGIKLHHNNSAETIQRKIDEHKSLIKESCVNDTGNEQS